MSDKLNIDAEIHISPSHQQYLSIEKLQEAGIQSNEKTPPSIIIISNNHDNFKQKVVESSQSQKKVFIITDSPDEKNVLEYLGGGRAHHIFGIGPHIIDELIQNIKKYQYGAFWGIEKNLAEDAKIKSTNIYHSKEINDEFDDLVSDIDLSQFFKSPIDYLRVISNELATNAFFHMSDIGDTKRSDSVFLTGSDSVEMKIAVDKKRIALSVTDHIGGLTYDKISESLIRCYKEKRPLNNQDRGAGLGLYMVFSHSNQLIINLDPKVKTEVISIIDANKRYLNYKKRITSFHFFNTKSIQALDESKRKIA